MRKQFRNFESARKYAHSLNLKSRSSWFALYDKGQLPENLPKYANEKYAKTGWISWSDFLASGTLSGPQRNKQMRSFEESKKFVRSLGIKTENQWREWCKNNSRPIDIPYSFERSYRDQWTSMGDFLGTGFIADKNKVWMSFEKARTMIRKLKLKNMREYKKEWNAGKIPKNIPANPNKVYEDEGWVNSGDWLGTGKISGKIKSENWLKWKDAKPKYLLLAKKYGLKNSTDWRKFTSKHQRELSTLNIPAKPWIVYSKERVWGNMK